MATKDQIAITDWKGLAPFYGQKVGRQNGWFDRLINLSTRYGSLRYENLVQITEVGPPVLSTGNVITATDSFLANIKIEGQDLVIVNNYYSDGLDFVAFSGGELHSAEGTLIIQTEGKFYLLDGDGVYWVIRKVTGTPDVYWLDLAGLPALDQTTYSAADDGPNLGFGKGLSPASDYEYIVVYGRNDRAVEGISLGFQSVLVTTVGGNDQRQVKISFPNTMDNPRTSMLPYSPIDYFDIYRKNPGGDLFLYMDRQAVTWAADMGGVLNAVDYEDSFSNEEVLARSLNPPRNAAGSFVSDGIYKEDKMDLTASIGYAKSIATDGRKMYALLGKGKVYLSRLDQPEHFQLGETIPDDQPVKQAGSFNIPSDGPQISVHSLLQHNQIVYAAGASGIFALVGSGETLTARKICASPVISERNGAWISLGPQMVWLSQDGFRASSGSPGSDYRVDQGQKFVEGIRFDNTYGSNPYTFGLKCARVGNKAFFVTHQYDTDPQTIDSFTALLCYDISDLDASGNGKWTEIIPTNSLLRSMICADFQNASLFYVGNSHRGSNPNFEHVAHKVFADLDKSTHTPHVNYVDGPFYDSGASTQLWVNATAYGPMPAVKDTWVVTIGMAGTTFTSTKNGVGSTSGSTAIPITIANGLNLFWSFNAAIDIAGNVYTFEISSQETYRARCISYWVLDALDWKKNSPMKLMVNWRKLAGANGFGSANGKSKIQVNVYGKKLDSAAHQYTSFVLYDTNEVSLPADKYDGIYYQDIKNGFEFESADWNYEVEQLHIEIAFLAAGSSPTDDFVVDSIYLENKDRERTPGRTGTSLG